MSHITPEQREALKVKARKRRKIRRVERTVSKLARMGLIYKLGGARLYYPRQEVLGPSGAGLPWTDCSGYVEYLLAVAGINLRNPAGWTGTLQAEGHEGLSPYLTLFIKEPDSEEGHVIMRLRHHPRWRRMLGMAARYRWTECGGDDNPQPGDGPTWFRPTAERVAEFPIHRCFEAL